jgi:hypothetical protein
LIWVSSVLAFKRFKVKILFDVLFFLLKCMVVLRLEKMLVLLWYSC